MCDEAVDACLSALFVPDWFVTNKMLGKPDDALFGKDDLIFIIKDSKNDMFLVAKWVFLIKLILIMLILMKTNLKQLFISHFWLGVTNLKYTKHIKNIYKQRINGCGIASYRMVGLILARR